ncbi:MAG: universal stress protein [Acidobacteria bacterium]|nr:MAG: universal stress protein [Acidobacteriota bacterium]RPJ85119.1 MAG: universal stress protein [Acidobacteriota bacterium]
MYKLILVTLENSAADQTILEHVERLAALTGSRLLLFHVADGWAARNFDELQLRESEEMLEDRGYLERRRAELAARGFDVEARLGAGDPATEICKLAEDRQVDLVAMATHGHRGVADVLHGETVDRVRHKLRMPVLLLRARPA